MRRPSIGPIILQGAVELIVTAREYLRALHLLPPIPARDNENAVIVSLKLSEGFGTDVERAGVLKLEETLRMAVESQRLGELDGDEFGHGAHSFTKTVRSRSTQRKRKRRAFALFTLDRESADTAFPCPRVQK